MRRQYRGLLRRPLFDTSPGPVCNLHCLAISQTSYRRWRTWSTWGLVPGASQRHPAIATSIGTCSGCLRLATWPSGASERSGWSTSRCGCTSITRTRCLRTTPWQTSSVGPPEYRCQTTRLTTRPALKVSGATSKSSPRGIGHCNSSQPQPTERLLKKSATGRFLAERAAALLLINPLLTRFRFGQSPGNGPTGVGRITGGPVLSRYGHLAGPRGSSSARVSGFWDTGVVGRRWSWRNVRRGR